MKVFQNHTRILVPALALLAGCFTVSETPYPTLPQTAPAAVTNVSVSVVGFTATVTELVSVYGYQTCFVQGPGGCYRGDPGCWMTMNTSTLVPQMRTTDTYLLRARDRLEQAGFVIAANPSDFVVEATFAGPFGAGSAGLRFLGTLFSIFTYNSSAYVWSAKLRIRDNKTGKLVFYRDYEQPHEIGIFSPIPLLGISSCDKTDPGYAQGWCLSALTDRMVADAAAFLRGQD